MVTESEALADFVPDILLARLVGASAVSGAVPLVAWFGDLSGFTALTEELAIDRAGPEQVTDLLNRCFAEVIDSIRQHGGDILGFAGDSILAGWTATEGDDLGPAVRLAAHCGLEAVGIVRRFGESQHRDLALRVGVGAGVGQLMDVGGDRNEWHFVAGGVPFVQMGKAQEIARPGEVVVSGDAWAAAGPRLRGLSSGGSVRVSGVDVDRLPGHRPVSVPDRIVIDLRNHVAETVRLRLEVGGGNWLAELRSISAVMVNLPKLFCVDQSDRSQVERAAQIVQGAIHRYEGTINKVLVDEKGTTFVCAFGLPPKAHVGDAVRALEAALDLNRQLVEARIEHGVGVATGRAFCGAYGGVGRRDYTMIGPVVNLAARLMKVSRNEVICDQNSAAASRPAIMLSEPQRVNLRGIAHPVDVYRALWPDDGAKQSSSVRRRVIGRERELRQLTAWLGALAHGKTSSVVVIDGEPGIGKTALVHELLDDAAAFRVRVGAGGSSELESASPYHAWRDLLDGLLGFGAELDADARAVAIAGRFEGRPDLEEWLPLLNAVIGTRLAENATTRAMSGTSRRSATIDVVVHLLQGLAAEQPIVAILEDMQWADSSSWALLAAVRREVQPILLVVTTRPEGLADETMVNLLAESGTAEMTLQPLDEEHVVALVADRLGVDDIPTEIANVITRKSEGHPLYAEELALALRDRGALSVRDGRVRLLMNESALAGLDLPNTLQDIVTSRLDQLSPRQQLTVKVASVVGRNFDDEIVREVHPVTMSIDELESELDELETMGLVDRGTETTHAFKHVIIQEAAYELLAYEQRRNLHRAVAEYLEGNETLSARYALLAHHWERADDAGRAVSYLERAGGTAFSKGSNKEAIAFHRKSLSLDAANGKFVSDRQRADWHTQLGQAHEALGDLAEAETQLRSALHYLGFEPLDGTVRKMAAVVWGLIVQVVHILIPISVKTPDSEEEAARLARAARVFALLGELSYFTVDLIGFPLYNLRAINLGEKSGHPVAAGVAYSSLGYLVGTLRLKRLARRYFRMARAAERFEAERDVTERVGSRSLADLGPGHLIAVALSESTYLLTFNRWKEGEPLVTDGIDRCARLGDHYSAEIGLAIRGFASHCTSAMDMAWKDYAQLLESSRSRDSKEHEGWAVALGIPVLLSMGRTQDAAALVFDADSLIEGADPLTVPIIYGTQAQYRLRVGDLRQARASADLALAAFDSTPIFIYLAGLTGMLETFTTLERETTDARDRKALRSQTRRGLRVLRTFASVLPFARPRYSLFKGIALDNRGRTRAARRVWRRGLKRAAAAGLVWDEGMLHHQLARTSARGSVEHRGHADRARECFAHVGAIYETDRLRDLR